MTPKRVMVSSGGKVFQWFGNLSVGDDGLKEPEIYLVNAVSGENNRVDDLDVIDLLKEYAGKNIVLSIEEVFFTFYDPSGTQRD